ncbi:MAG: DNA polymerase III subunit delta [Chitinispirillaceae bacterium]|nr:DNA polymerase III subunit delta [Chitinispirillaceae bacterium]
MSKENKTTAQVYLFSGDDLALRTVAKEEKLKELFLSFPDILIEDYNPEKVSFTEYIEKMLTPSLFGGKRLFRINHAEELSEEELINLSKIISLLPEDIYLFIDINEGEGKKKSNKGILGILNIEDLIKKDSSRFIHHNFQKPPEYKMVEWIEKNAKILCGREITREAAEFLVDLVGYDTAMILQELKKIDNYLDEGEEIDKEIIEFISGSSRNMTAFELADACGSKDMIRAKRIIDSLFAGSCYLPLVIAALSRYYLALFRISQYIKKYPQDLKTFRSQGGNEAALRIGIAAGLLGEGDIRKVYPVIIKSGIVDQAQAYTEIELKKILSLLTEFDYEIKSGKKQGDKTELLLFCYKLINVSKIV